jgi:hypothetical protein
MSRSVLLIITITVLAAAGNVPASEIYKRTNADGNVEYIDRPTGNPGEQRISVASSRTDDAAVSARVQAQLDAQAKRQEMLSNAAEEEQSALEAQAEREELAAQCETYRARMQGYLQARRMYREDESGERVYFDEEQMLAARADLQKQIQETCN